jgi:hypothetical protein
MKTPNLPVSADGSYPTPTSCLSGGGYWAGPKGAERKYHLWTDFIAALEAMPIARWRHRDGSGNLGLVTGVKWQSVEA